MLVKELCPPFMVLWWEVQLEKYTMEDFTIKINEIPQKERGTVTFSYLQSS